MVLDRDRAHGGDRLPGGSAPPPSRRRRRWRGRRTVDHEVELRLGRQPAGRPLHARQPRHVGLDHHLRRDRAGRQRARPARAAGQRRARLCQYRQLHDERRLPGRDHRTLRQPHRQGPLHARQHAVLAGHQQQPEHPPRRLQRLQRQGLGGHAGPDAGFGRRQADVHVARRRGVHARSSRARRPARRASRARCPSPSCTRWTPATTCGSTTRRRPTRRPSSTSPTTPTGTSAA